jgi:hypothetical protein
MLVVDGEGLCGGCLQGVGSRGKRSGAPRWGSEFGRALAAAAQARALGACIGGVPSQPGGRAEPSAAPWPPHRRRLPSVAVPRSRAKRQLASRQCRIHFQPIGGAMASLWRLMALMLAALAVGSEGAAVRDPPQKDIDTFNRIVAWMRASYTNTDRAVRRGRRVCRGAFCRARSWGRSGGDLGDPATTNDQARAPAATATALDARAPPPPNAPPAAAVRHAREDCHQ